MEALRTLDRVTGLCYCISLCSQHIFNSILSRNMMLDHVPGSRILDLMSAGPTFVNLMRNLFADYGSCVMILYAQPVLVSGLRMLDPVSASCFVIVFSDRDLVPGSRIVFL